MKKHLALFLALITLLSNVGLTLATHYYGGQAVKSQIIYGHKYRECGIRGMEVFMDNESKEVLTPCYNTSYCQNHLPD